MRATVLLAVPESWETTVVDAIAAAPGLDLARRCADLPELLSTAAAGLGESALVSAGLAGLDRTAVVELERYGVRVVGVVRPGDAADKAQERSLRGRGIAVVVPADAGPDRLQTVLTGRADPEVRAWLAGLAGDGADPAEAASDDSDPTGRAGLDGLDRGGGHADGRRADGPPGAWPAYAGAGGPLEGHAAPDIESGWRPREADATPSRRPAAPRPGQIVAVWGPAGAPGRSSIALGIASEAARAGVRTLLVDADPYGGVQAASLAILDESPGLAGAVRRADQGDLDVPDLVERCLQVAPGLALLAGISRADRWPELRPDPLDRVLTLARQVAELVVVDCGFSVEDDEELSYDTSAPRRNGATLATLACADHLVVVGGADPIGLLRLVRGLAEIDTIRTPARRTVVVNRLRESAVGRRPEDGVAAALQRFAGLADVWFVPDDREAFDRAALQGRTLAECAPQSPARVALAGRAAHRTGRPAGRADGRGATGRRGRRRRRA